MKDLLPDITRVIEQAFAADPLCGGRFCSGTAEAAAKGVLALVGPPQVDGDLIEEMARALCAANFAKKGAEGEFGTVDDCWWAFKDEATAALAIVEPALRAAEALLAKVDADSSVRWKFVNERESLRSALAPMVPEARAALNGGSNAR